MRNGDLEFHQQTEPILDAISSEGLRIAKDNGWGGLVIEMVSARRGIHGSANGLRCSLVNPLVAEEIDEPSARLLDAADQLQGVFVNVGTPLAGATMDWIDESGDGNVRRRCSFRYE